MLLNRLQVKNSRGAVLDLPLEDESDGFAVRGVDGLDPVKATLVSSSFANADGEQYQSSRREARNILIHLGLIPDYGSQSVKDLRDQLYGFFMPKSVVDLSFSMFDKFATNFLKQTLDLMIQGRIESFESALFTRDPVVDISVMCYDPDFYDPNSVIFAGMSVTDLAETTLTYDGTTDTGGVFTLLPDSAMSQFTIYHRPPDGTLNMLDFAYPLAAGDVLSISSVQGSKYVRLRSSGVDSSVLYAMSPQSNWLTLQPGDNSIRVYSDSAPVPYTFEYTNKYGGL